MKFLQAMAKYPIFLPPLRIISSCGNIAFRIFVYLKTIEDNDQQH